jgi:hypothetical protein
VCVCVCVGVCACSHNGILVESSFSGPNPHIGTHYFSSVICVVSELSLNCHLYLSHCFVIVLR